MEYKYDIKKIMDFLPHRYPFLLVDRILEVKEDEVIGLKNVTFNEPFFIGHFPGHPIMPGVLIIESMAQTGGVLMMEEVENPEDKVVYFMKIDNVKFKKPVVPGDTLIHHVKLIKKKRNILVIHVDTKVNDEIVASGDFTAMVVDK